MLLHNLIDVTILKSVHVLNFRSYDYSLSKIYSDNLIAIQEIPATINPNAANPTIAKIRNVII
jgi:hypothetical protein